MQKTKIAGALAALTLCANANVALAQLEEVVVTAQKREQSANDIGMSISALSSDALAEMRVLDSTDLALAVPGLTYADVGSGTPIYTLRGVGFNESSLQAQSTVGIYTDEVATPFPIMTNGLIMDLERVEVMKGPQGTLFGRNTTGGAINYIANKPSDNFEAGVTVGYGRFETTDAEAYINGALTDSVRARLAVKTIQSSEGWQESVTRNDELGEQDRISARLLVAADVGDSFDALLSLSWWRDKSDSLAPQFVEANYQNQNPLVIDALAPYHVPDSRDDNDRADWTVGSSPSKDMENKTASLTLNWQINDDLKLTSLTSYSEFDDESLFNRDGYDGAPISDPNVAALIPVNATPALGGTWEPPASGYLNNSAYGSDSNIDAFSQELRLTGTAESFTWILGAYYSEDTVDAKRPQFTEMTSNTNALAEVPGLGFFGLQGADYNTKQDGDAWAVFAHTEININEQWMLTLGARYTEDNKDFKGCARDKFGDMAILFGVNPGDCITQDVDTGVRQEYKNSLDEDSVSGKVAINYNLNDDTLLYLSYSRGYKSGSFPTIAATQSFQMDPVEQEKLDAYEGGFKLRLAEGKAQLNGAVFYYDYSDKQLLAKVQDPQFGSLFRLTNIPDSEIFGAEIELQWQPTEGLYLGFAGSYLDTEINEFFGFTQDSLEPFDLSGSDMPLTPEYQASATANYEWTVWQNMTAFVGGDLTYSDSFQTDYASGEAPLRPVYEVDSYTLLGLRAGLRAADGRWSVMAWGRNVTDEFYATNVYKSVDSIIRTNGMPATYGVSFSYNWL